MLATTAHSQLRRDGRTGGFDASLPHLIDLTSLSGRDRRNIVLANLVQERAVADAQQLGSSLSVPARFPQSTADRVNLGLIAMAAKRQVSRRLQTSSRCGLANVWLPRIGAGGALITAVLALEFGVIHKLTP